MKHLKLAMTEQKNGECLPTALAAVLSFLGKPQPVGDLIREISTDSSRLHDWLYRAGRVALKLGLKARVQSLAPRYLDPSWRTLTPQKMQQRLEAEHLYYQDLAAKNSVHAEFPGALFNNPAWLKNISQAAEQAELFLREGGELRLQPITINAIKKSIESEVPVLFSHDAALLHGKARAFANKPDDVRGITWGHVAVITGYDAGHFVIADPDGIFNKGTLHYKMPADLVLESILRYNGELLFIDYRQGL